MRKVFLGNVKPGEKIAKSVFLPNGGVLLGVGVVLNDRYIERLRSLGIDSVYVDDAATRDIVPEEPIREETRAEAVKALYKTMTEMMDSPAVKGRSASNDLGKLFRTTFTSILDDLQRKPNVTVHLSSLYTTDGYLFHHSVNVAVLAGIIGLAKGYSRSQMLDLGVGALLFDIGMTSLPKEILNKKTPLTPEEFAVMQSHTQAGFDILRKNYDISLLSAHCALQHHERISGGGYPQQLESGRFHDYAQIVAIADVYDALTSPRPYRTSYSPVETIEYMYGIGNEIVSMDILRLFFKYISIYPEATTVVLNNGQVGVVSKNNLNAAHRPVVRILEEADGTPVFSPYEINLTDQLNLVIVGTK